MANPYYDHGSVPATGSTGSSASMRAEFDAVEAGFDKLPTLSGYGNKAVVVNAGGTALTTTSGSMSLTGDLTLAGALTTSGAYGLTFTLTALTSLTLPTSGTLATLAGTETLTNKTLNLTSNTLAGTIAQFNAACSDADFATLAGTETFTNKTLNLTSNTLAGTIAQFNAACSDADFATLAGTETLTNKTLNLTSNTLAGTIAQFNAACSDADFATLAGTETLTNKTLTGPTVSNPVFSGTVTGTYTLGGTPTINGAALTIGTSIATTSGTAHDFTSIPSWVKRITVSFSGVSTNGTSGYLLQIGDSGGIETSGYVGVGMYSTVGTSANGYTTGFAVAENPAAADAFSGVLVLTLLNAATNTWSAFAVLSAPNSSKTVIGSGSKSLSATLDRIRLTTVGGTDAFDAGAVNILYE